MWEFNLIDDILDLGFFRIILSRFKFKRNRTCQSNHETLICVEILNALLMIEQHLSHFINLLLNLSLHFSESCLKRPDFAIVGANRSE